MKIKRFAVLIPLLFTLLLSIVPLGTSFADTSTTFVDDPDFPFPEFYTDEFITSYQSETVSSLNAWSSSVARSRGLDTYQYYFYSFWMTYDDYYNRYTNPSSQYQPYFNSVCYLFNSSDIVYEDDGVVIFNCIGGSKCRYVFDGSAYRTISSYESSMNKNNSYDYFTYHKTLGTFQLSGSNTSPSSVQPSNLGLSLNKDHCFFYQASNIPNFPFADGMSHNENNFLDISVSFSPALSGDVSRAVGTGSNISYLQNLSMFVSNNSSFACQYKFYIMKTNQSSHRPWSASGGDSSAVVAQHQIVYDDDPVFIYYSDEWVYSANLDNSSDWYNGHPQKQNKSTEWHYLSSNSSQTITFKFSQINLQEGESYTAIVEAVRNDYDCASRLWVSSATSEGVYPEYKQISIDDKITAYSSSFTMLQYSDVKYDHNDNSNGINPYSNYSDLESYNWSYNAKEENGVTDYTNKNLYTDSNSWYRQSYNTSNISYPSSSSSFNSSTTYISSFLSFVSNVLGYFPSSIFNIYALGMTSLVVIVLIKVVFR